MTLPEIKQAMAGLNSDLAKLADQIDLLGKDLVWLREQIGVPSEEGKKEATR